MLQGDRSDISVFIDTRFEIWFRLHVSFVLLLTNANIGTLCHNVVGCWQDGNCLIHQWNQVPIPGGRTDLRSWAVKSAELSWSVGMGPNLAKQQNQPPKHGLFMGYSTFACAISRSLLGDSCGVLSHNFDLMDSKHKWIEVFFFFRSLDFVFCGSPYWRNPQYGCVFVCVCLFYV